MVRITRFPIRLISCSLTISLLTAGCTHIRTVAPDSEPAQINRINREVGNQPGRLKLRKGEVHSGQLFHIAPDTTVCLSRTFNERQAFPNGDIRHLVFPDRSRGLAEGTMYGAVTGAALGMLVGLTVLYSISQPYNGDSSPPPDSTWVCGGTGNSGDLSVVASMALGAAVGTVSGALLGSIIGNIAGSRLKIRFEFSDWHSRPR